jgi:SAM-dependent methyltransferase
MPGIDQERWLMMALARYVASQLRKPRGPFGRLLIAPLLNRANAAMNALTLESLGAIAGDRVLEVGFGGGALLRALAAKHPGLTLHGADFSRDMAHGVQARLRPLIAAGRLHLTCASVQSLPYADGAFTKICTVNTLYFWPDCAAGLAELRRVLSAGGELVITIGDAEAMRKMPVTAHGFTIFTPADVQRLLEAAGFSDIRVAHSPDSSRKFSTIKGRRVASS